MPAMLLRRVAFPDFCEPCLPSPALKPPAGDGWLHEIKHDGFRLLVRRDAGGVRLFTRNGHDWTGRFSVREPEVHVRGRRPFPIKPRGSRYGPVSAILPAPRKAWAITATNADSPETCRRAVDVSRLEPGLRR
jgi:hypothetical protein